MLFSMQSHAETLRLAVASNFNTTIKQLASDFEASTGHNLLISSASTGKLFAQIQKGAPFDVFLSADEQRADRIIELGLADASSASVYALGKLVFISNLVVGTDCESILESDRIRHLAIANPKTAPYGAAAKDVLQNIEQWQRLHHKLVSGENISQTLQFVSSGSATAGFVAQSLLINKNINYACLWNIPETLYSPIKQKMVVLSRSADKEASRAFVNYMQSPRAKIIITRNGYGVL